MDFHALVYIKKHEGMKSDIPTAMHELCGRPIFDYCLELVLAAKPLTITITAEDEGFKPKGCEYDFVLGTVDEAMESLKARGRILAFDGSMTWLNQEKMPFLLEHMEKFKMAATDVTELLLSLHSANWVGIGMVTSRMFLGSTPYSEEDNALMQISADIKNIRNRRDLSQARDAINYQTIDKHLLNGVTIYSPCTIGRDVVIGQDSVIHPGVTLEGKTVIGAGCVIGPGTMLVDSVTGDKVKITHTVAEGAEIGDGSSVGPFAYLRKGSKIGKNCKIGDFVEVKNATFGDNSKASHLSYIGDAIVGEHVNIGCGTITVNYDGVNKHITNIGDGAFVGCNSNLIAPVTVGAGAFIAAGSTITADVSDNSLAIARERQVERQGWATDYYKRNEKQ